MHACLIEMSGLIEMHAKARIDEEHAFISQSLFVRRERNVKHVPQPWKPLSSCKHVRRVQAQNGTKCSKNTKQADRILLPLTTRQLRRLP